MAKDKIVSEIYETYEYSKFSPLVQNRGAANKKGIKQSKLSKLMELFEKNEWVPELGVIKVNKEFKVIDGHHRLALLEQLKMPIWYQIVQHDKFNEVNEREFLSNTYKTNQVRTDWTQGDFFKAAVQKKFPLAIRIQGIIHNNMNYFGLRDMLALLLKDSSLFVGVPNTLREFSLFEDKTLVDYSNSKEFLTELEYFIKINNKIRIAPYRYKVLALIYEVIFNSSVVINPDRFRQVIPSIPERALQSLKFVDKEETLRVFVKYYNAKTKNAIRVDSVLKEIRETKALLSKSKNIGDKTA
jgi:hypothetical protein